MVAHERLTEPRVKKWTASKTKEFLISQRFLRFYFYIIKNAHYIIKQFVLTRSKKIYWVKNFRSDKKIDLRTILEFFGFYDVIILNRSKNEVCDFSG